MKSVCLLVFLVALSQGAKIVLPIQNHRVDVRKSGDEFSYNIQENRGVAAISDAEPAGQHLVKTVLLEEKPTAVEHFVKEEFIPAHQDQAKLDPKLEVRSAANLKELKKPEEVKLVAQPLFAAPLDYQQTYYIPYSYLPKTSYIHALPTVHYPFYAI